MKRSVMAIALLTASCASRGGESGGVDAQMAFARMKSLAGTFHAMSTSAEAASVDVSYEITSGGHALLEKLFAGTEQEMTSMYYLEGRDLVMVHYCSMGNRPHLRLDRARSTMDDFAFEWDDGATDVDPAKDDHIHRMRLHWKDATTIEADWVAWKQGKEGDHATFTLSKTAGSFTPPSGATK